LTTPNVSIRKVDFDYTEAKHCIDLN